MGLSDDQFELLYIQEWLVAFGLDLFLTGIYTCIIFFILYFFFSTQRYTSSKILILVILSMFVIRMIHVGTLWYQTWFAFIQNGDSRDSVMSALDDSPDLAVSDVTSMLLIAIADSVMVWRCWIISNFSKRLTVLPFLLNLLGIVFGLVFVSCDRPGSTPQVAFLMSTLNKSFSVATTILSTLIITIRILMADKVPGDTGVGDSFSKPLTIIIESSALYTIAFSIYIPFFAIDSDFTDTTSLFIASVAQNMTVISPALIMLRVLMGKALPGQTQHHDQSLSKMTTLRFEQDGSGSEESKASHISSSRDEGGEIGESVNGRGHDQAGEMV